MAAITYPFSTISDTILFDATMPDKIKLIHTYCLKRLNIKGWRINPADIAKEFKCSIKTACRALWWFRDHGYGAKTNDGRWIIYPTPKTPDIKDIEPIEAWTKVSILEPVLMDKNVQLIEIKAFKEKETTTPEPIKQPDTVTPVVVFLEKEKQPEPIKQPDSIAPVIEEESPSALKYPEELTPKQKADIKHHIKKAPIEHRQAILATLAHYLAKGTIYNPIGWIRSQAEGAAKTGTYEQVGAASATKTAPKHRDKVPEQILQYRELPLNKPDVWKAKAKGLRAAL